MDSLGNTNTAKSQKDVIYDTIKTAADFIAQRSPFPPLSIEIGIICGSGLRVIASILEDGATDIPYKSIPGFPTSSVDGHSNTVTIGKVSAKNAICFQGRSHYYEGLPMWKVTMPIRIMKLLGVKVVFVTNAAGGVDKTYGLGDVMVIKDHINLCGSNPLIGENDPRWGPRFPDLRDAYDSGLRGVCRNAFQSLGPGSTGRYREGVYCMVSGPSYETNAEVHMMRHVGVGTMGMSTVPEVIVANHAQVKVCAMSVVASTLEDDGAAESLSHEVVLEIAQKGGSLISEVIRIVVSQL